MIDPHCHLDLPPLGGQAAAVLGRARAAGVERVLVPGLHADQWGPLRRLCAELGQAFALGTHPRFLGRGPPLPEDLSGAVAIGECGLDGAAEAPLSVQLPVFEAQLVVARERGLPVILHVYKAHDEALELARRFAPLRGVVHSYSGGPERVQAWVELGLHLSYSGSVTWPGARRPAEALRRTPRHRLLAETDAPDQCPHPERLVAGTANEPAYLPTIVAAMERIRGEPLVDVLRENAAALGWA